MTQDHTATRIRQNSEGGASEVVRIRLLGGFRAEVGRRTIEEGGWRLKRAANLVKLLALAPEHRLHRERVMDALWPDLAKGSQTNNLYRTLHTARRTLGDETADTDFSYLRLEEDLLSLCPDGELWTDVEAFEVAAKAAARSGEPAVYRAALDLYAGDLLPENLYEEWTQARREGLRQLYLTLLLEMAAICEERGDYEPAIEALGRAVIAEPVNEEAHRGLMRLYGRSGRRQQALLQYRRLEEALDEQLDTRPDDASRRLYEDVRADRLPAFGPVSAPQGQGEHNLPTARSSFVGRERELVKVRRALAMTRVMTLTGAGGCGKTRLALEVARDLVGTYPDGIWLAELAPLSDPRLLPRTVAAALDVPEQPGRRSQDVLAEYFESRSLLLILDNCEHLVERVAQLADDLLGACPHLKILATSREPIGISGETVWSVPPLSLPGADGRSTVESLMRCEAVQLFVDRARSRLPAFQLTSENAGPTASVCSKLDGIPLAIELATARMGTLAVEQVASRLEDSLALLTGGARTADPRQQTMRATLQWSYDLLPDREKVLLARLSIFAGGWSLGAAEEVCLGNAIAPGDILDLLGRLVDKSLVLTEGNDGVEARYRMLEPVRQYALERLEESGEAQQLRERHARHYLALAETAEPRLVGPDQVAWLERLATEYPNLRSALSWCLYGGEKKPEGRAEMGLRLAAALGRFWGNLGSSEGREWLEKGLAKSGAAPASVRAKALSEAGFIAVFLEDPRAAEMLEESLAIYKKLKDKTGQAIVLTHVMHTVGLLGNLERAPTLRQETIALLEEHVEDPRAAAYAHMTLGALAMLEPDPEQVMAQMEKALSLFREAGDLWSSAHCLMAMTIAALGRADAEDAARACEEALRLLRQLKDRIRVAVTLTLAAGVAVLKDQPARAASLFGAAEAVRRSIGHRATQLKLLRYDYEAYMAATRTELGEAAFEAAFSEGLAMSSERAVEYALKSDSSAPSPTPSVVPGAENSRSFLTQREKEVSLLAAKGLSNRQIASKLSISEHTVAAHVRKILKKLGLRSRTQISPQAE